MSLKVQSLVLSIAILSTYNAKSQDNALAAFPHLVPPSPDAAALGKYGEIPVGTYTGIPEISIPYMRSQQEN